MDFVEIYTFIKEFCKSTHGSSNYDNDEIFVVGEKTDEFAPLGFLKKKIPELQSEEQLLSSGFIQSSFEFMENSTFKEWYEKQFAKKLSMKDARNISFLYKTNNKVIFDALEKINKSYNVLREQRILINSKNFPIQLGEWYAKTIFGLKQIKSSSQRGFDFELHGDKIEVKIHWGDRPSPKGVKIRKALVELSTSCIVMYISQNFMIREICFLDSEFVLRKFTGKGHTIFLKDSEIAVYFFSKSSKQFDKVVNKTALMTFASPALALKLDGRL